jgi:hypothetical protein
MANLADKETELSNAFVSEGNGSLLRSLFAGPRFSPHLQAAYCSNTFHSDCLADHSLSTKIRNSFALKFTNSETKMASYDQALCEVAQYFVFLLLTIIRRMRFEQQLL